MSHTTIPEASWMAVAYAELGVREVAGKAHNRTILQYGTATKGGITDDETPWCSAFANWVFKQFGIQGTQTRAALDWLTWGHFLPFPLSGCIGVIDWRRLGKTGGHVGFVVGQTATGLVMLGGNQNNSVSYAVYPFGHFVGFRWPKGHERILLPVMPLMDKHGTQEGTR